MRCWEYLELVIALFPFMDQVYCMSITEIKERIIQLNAEERDEIMMHILSLKNEYEFELSEEWNAELDARKEAYECGEIGARPYDEVIKELGLR